MKIVHTADWHLGQKFFNKDREVEQQTALNQLLNIIVDEKADVLIVAGDVFDVMSPPNFAQRMYYEFLRKVVMETYCTHLVIIGGNHDSPAMLNAPRELLRALNIHIVGAFTGRVEDELVLLRTSDGRLQAVVAAVPFLRDQDIRLITSGESESERVESVRIGIKQHYEKIAELAAIYKTEGVPIIATGHLFATDTKNDHQRNIYAGNIENIAVSDFPTVFDYVALGHIHTAQRVGGIERVQYAGSLIPLYFEEGKDKKTANIVEFNEDGGLKSVSRCLIFSERKVISIKETLENVKKALEALKNTTAWVEIILKGGEQGINILEQLNEVVANTQVEILRIGREKTSHDDSKMATFAAHHLAHLTPEEVFAQRCNEVVKDEKELKALKTTFLELLEWMKTKV